MESESQAGIRLAHPHGQGEAVEKFITMTDRIVDCVAIEVVHGLDRTGLLPSQAARGTSRISAGCQDTII